MKNNEQWMHTSANPPFAHKKNIVNERWLSATFQTSMKSFVSTPTVNDKHNRR